MVIYLRSGSEIIICINNEIIGEAIVTYIDDFKQEIGIKKLRFQPDNIKSSQKGTIRLILRKNGWQEIIEDCGKSYLHADLPLTFRPI